MGKQGASGFGIREHSLTHAPFAALIPGCRKFRTRSTTPRIPCFTQGPKYPPTPPQPNLPQCPHLPRAVPPPTPTPSTPSPAVLASESALSTSKAITTNAESSVAQTPQINAWTRAAKSSEFPKFRWLTEIHIALLREVSPYKKPYRAPSPIPPRRLVRYSPNSRNFPRVSFSNPSPRPRLTRDTNGITPPMPEGHHRK